MLCRGYDVVCVNIIRRCFIYSVAFWWLIARLQYLHCYCTGDTAILHQTMYLMLFYKHLMCLHEAWSTILSLHLIHVPVVPILWIYGRHIETQWYWCIPNQLIILNRNSYFHYIIGKDPGGHLGLKMPYQYRDPHVKDKTVSRLSYL